MEADSQILLSAHKWGGAGEIPGHLQQGHHFAPTFFADIVADPFATQVTKAILGEGVYNRFYNGNANCPGSGTQPLHPDTPHLWPTSTMPHPPASLVVNVSLVDVSEANGATELWPGTHLIAESTADRFLPKQKHSAGQLCRPYTPMRAKAVY